LTSFEKGTIDVKIVYILHDGNQDPQEGKGIEKSPR